MRRRLRNCTKRLLQIAWQKHKTMCSTESRRQSFWRISEAQLVLSAWKREKLIRFDSVHVEGDMARFSDDFLSNVEALPHPGRSSLFKKRNMYGHRASSVTKSEPPLQSSAAGSLPSDLPGCTMARRFHSSGSGAVTAAGAAHARQRSRERCHLRRVHPRRDPGGGSATKGQLTLFVNCPAGISADAIIIICSCLHLRISFCRSTFGKRGTGCSLVRQRQSGAFYFFLPANWIEVWNRAR